MEPNLETPDNRVPDAIPKRSRVKAAVAAVVVAGALSAWGVASVFAASPTTPVRLAAPIPSRPTRRRAPPRTDRPSEHGRRRGLAGRAVFAVLKLHRTSGMRELDLEASAACGPVGGRDPAAMMLGNPRGDRQAESGAAGWGVGGPPETVEEVRQVLRADAGPLVLDRDPWMRVSPDPDPHLRARG